MTPELLESDTFLRAFHHVLLEARTLSLLGRAWTDAAAQVHIEEGVLVCPESGHRFPIRFALRPPRCFQRLRARRCLTHAVAENSEGIPNMLLAEDEVATK